MKAYAFTQLTEAPIGGWEILASFLVWTTVFGYGRGPSCQTLAPAPKQQCPSRNGAHCPLPHWQCTWSLPGLKTLDPTSLTSPTRNPGLRPTTIQAAPNPATPNSNSAVPDPHQTHLTFTRTGSISQCQRGKDPLDCWWGNWHSWQDITPILGLLSDSLRAEMARLLWGGKVLSPEIPFWH